MQAEILRTEDLLTEAIARDPQPQFAPFDLDGQEHLAYYAPHEVSQGRIRYIFECLIY